MARGMWKSSGQRGKGEAGNSNTRNIFVCSLHCHECNLDTKQRM